MSDTIPVFVYVVGEDGILGEGKNIAIERDAGIPEGFVVVPKALRGKKLRIVDGEFVEYDDPAQAEAEALAAIMARQAAAPLLIAKIAHKITSEAVTLAERVTLGPLITQITALLQAGSFADAQTVINAFDASGLSEAAFNVLQYADSELDDAIEEYYPDGG